MNAVAIPEISLDAFEEGTIDAEAFDHEAHVYVGWLYLEHYPLLESIDRYSVSLRRLTARLGVPGKYHETITWFFLVLISERRAQTSHTNWFEFRRKNDDLFHGSRILGRYYSKELLTSDRARQTFILPDRCAN